ncbi:ATP-binding protein [Pseudoalteromonas fenneropenaei]|uniref:histidine kinase n=1 Tax=Pseudoalteromonas fenneropenaei TaxID=1737459 RepID=A0ABV7CK82_9GAMM
MLRLAVSLILLVLCSIFAINLLSELLWQSVQGEQEELAVAQQLATQQQQFILQQPQLAAQRDSLTLAQFAWLPEQLAKLQAGELVMLYPDDSSVSFYFLMPDQAHLQQLGPYRLPPSEQYLKWAIRLASYALLALLLWLWLRPLWRDLNQLKLLTEQLARGELELQLAPVHFSAIAKHTAQIQGLTKRIARLMDNQKHLVSAVSHELRTPLARLKFALAMLSSVDPEQRRGIQQDIQDMEKLIEEMLSYARLEFANQALSKAPLDFSKLVHSSVSALGEHKERKLQLELIAECKVLGNAHYLERAVVNLVGNAVKYSHSQVQVSLVFHAGRYALIIEDDGPGIAEADHERIFMPFQRLAGEGKQAKSGFGLGLAIVKRILDWHQIECQISRSPLGGAKFTLLLPRFR